MKSKTIVQLEQSRRSQKTKLQAAGKPGRNRDIVFAIPAFEFRRFSKGGGHRKGTFVNYRIRKTGPFHEYGKYGAADIAAP